MPADALVSVIVPTYNYAQFVGRAVNSVLRQTYSRVECIVVDDGSEDETQDVLSAYKDRIHVVRTANCGLSSARNTGIAHATGELLAFLDADDFWADEKLETQVDWLVRHPDVGAVGCGVAVADSEGVVTRTNPGHRCPTDRRERLRKVALRQSWLMGSGSGVLLRRSVFDTVGRFEPNLRAAEDWDMWLRVAAAFPFDNVPTVLTTIRKHHGGVFRDPSRMADAQWQVYRRAVAAWPDILTAPVRAGMRALIMSDMGVEYLAAGKLSSALWCQCSAITTWPFDKRQWQHAARLARCLVRPA